MATAHDEITASEAARREGMSVSGVTKEIHTGRLPARWDGWAYRIRGSDQEVWSAGRRSRLTRRKARPTNALQERLDAYIRDTHTTITAIAEQVGCTRDALYRWRSDDDRTLSERIMRPLAELLGISFEIAKAEAGGQTADERIAANARLQLQKVPQPGTVEFASARAKAGKTLRGRPRQPEDRAKIAEGNRRAGSGERGRAELAKWRENPDYEVIQQLWMWLRWHPNPKRPEIHEYAEVVASRLDPQRNVEEILLCWKPYLERLHKWTNRGRPRSDDKRTALREILAAVIGVDGAESWSLSELEAQVGLIFWQRGSWKDVPASRVDPAGYDGRYQKTIVARVDRLIGCDCRKSLQIATAKF